MLFDHPPGRVQHNAGVLLGQKADACCLRNLQSISPLASAVGGFPGLALCQPRCAPVPSLSPAVCVPADVTEHCWLPMVGESRHVSVCSCGLAELQKSAFPRFMDPPPLLPSGNNIAESACPREGAIWWHSGVAES